MTEEFAPSYIKSDKKGYVLVSERALLANSHAFASAVRLLADLTKNDEATLSQMIGRESREHVLNLPESEVQRIINSAISCEQADDIQVID